MGERGTVAMASVGTVVLKVIVHGRTRTFNLKDALHVASIRINLVSVGMMEERGAEVCSKGGKAIIKLRDKVAAWGTRKSGLYHLDIAPLSHDAAVASL